MNAQCLRTLKPALQSAPLALRLTTRRELARHYATQTGPRPKRRNITVLSDDGRYEWGELSGREKVSRATQQSINFVVVIAGAVLTDLECSQGGVFYLFWTDVVSPNSRTWQYEKAVERVKEDPRCIQLLGDRREIRAFGETTNSRWARNRPIASTIEKDRLGREHLRMNFNVEGPLNTGVVFVHLMKPLDKDEWEYQLLALDVKGHSRIILEKAAEKPGVASSLKLFGIQWR
ncbi:L-galactonate dehydratase [Penicillium diatomitis]|uniref:Mitochondrial import inner membrane translocase subunit Tim21 n=1 Tax=Penicillium diatomitis TaxID=2819901 RepID=A0A9W9X6A5_9EURO|nr:L-galactonate dehydratase [Penicillium diatomitis]KAJ5485108.1 L-galactonate dehydratase [Penicillium diatomitis]